MHAAVVLADMPNNVWWSEHYTHVCTCYLERRFEFDIRGDMTADNIPLPIQLLQHFAFMIGFWQQFHFIYSLFIAAIANILIIHKELVIASDNNYTILIMWNQQHYSSSIIVVFFGLFDYSKENIAKYNFINLCFLLAKFHIHKNLALNLAFLYSYLI